MKNKKGVSIGRIILYCFFLSLLGLLIYSIYLGVKGLKEKTPEIQQSSLRYAYNADFQYSAADYVNSSYINIFNVSSVARDIDLGNYDISLSGGLYNTYPPVGNNKILSAFYYASEGRATNVQYEFKYQYVSDNELILSNAIRDIINASRNADYEWNNGGIDETDCFDIFPSNAQSACLVVECSIPINLFNFHMTSTSSALNGNGGDFYIYGSSTADGYVSGSAYATGWRNSSGGYAYTSDRLPSAFVSNYNYVRKIVIPFYQTRYAQEGAWYGLNYTYSYSLANLVDSNFDFRMVFDIYTASSAEQDAYIRGYEEGKNAADSALESYNDELIAQVNTLNYSIDELRNTIAQQSSIISNLQSQLDSINSGQYSFKNLFWTIADTPFKTVHNILNFDFFGVNLFRFFVGVITSLGMIWLIKKMLGK